MSRDLTAGLAFLAALSALDGTAVAAPLVHNGPAFRWAVGADPHLDWDWYQSGQDTTAMFFGAAAGAMHADGVIILGDLYGARKSDLDGDRDWECPLLPNGTVDRNGLRRWDGACEYPSPWLGAKYRQDILAWDPAETHPTLIVAGDHYGTIPQPSLPSLDTIDEWEAEWFRPATQPCVVAHDHEVTRCDLVVADPGSGTSYAWTVLILADQTAHMDRAVGGHCDIRDYHGLQGLREGCSAYGWPNGTITAYQLEWLESQIALAQRENRGVGIASHQPVPNTVALTGDGEAYTPQCATGILVHTPPDLTTQYPRDADYLPLRTDLDTPIPGDPTGRTPIRAAAENVGRLVRWYPGQSPDPAALLDLVRRYPGVVRFWLSGHNHVPVPDLVDTDGRGMIYRDPVSGTAFMANGAITRYFLTTSGTGHPMASTLDLGSNGTWAWTRWSIQSHASGVASHGCGTPAQLPPTRPAPWVNVPVETGP